MKHIFTKAELPEVIHIQPEVYKDSRGWLTESYNNDVFKDNGINEDFVQEKHSFSKYNVLRGLHFQKEPFGQGKLVRCSYGKVWDVVVDIRHDSENHKKWIGVELSYKKKNMVYIPPGFAHGFLVLSKSGAGFSYMTTAHFNKDADSGIKFDDNDINIEWPIVIENTIISEKDKNLPFLKDLRP